MAYFGMRAEYTKSKTSQRICDTKDVFELKRERPLVTDVQVDSR